MAWFPPNLEINSKTSNSWSVFLGKFAEVSDPTVGVDFFARLVITCHSIKNSTSVIQVG